MLQRDTVTAPVGQEGQLVAAVKQASLWDFKEVTHWARKKGIEVDPGAHGRAALQWADGKDDQADQNADQAKP